MPLLVVSPFSRGGHIATEVFDHTSQLKLISERFGVEVPNVSAWRRKTVGDLTSTLFHSKTDTSVPKLPKALSGDEAAIPDEARTPIDVSGPPNETVKSRGNRLMTTRPPGRP